MQTQIMDYMNTTKQWNKNLHAYQKIYSTTTAALHLTDFTIEAADMGKVANCMQLNQSAAFDCVNSKNLDRKLELYKFSKNTRKWFSSYLEHRSQYVAIGAAVSNLKPVYSGVPQGSVLGPILYSLYTNELPEVIKSESCPEICHLETEDLFGRNCWKCGIAPSFTDDCTVVVARKNPDENKLLLENKLKSISEFLQNNELCINEDKTKVQNFMVKQRRARTNCTPEVMTVESPDGEKILVNQMHTRWLGFNLHQDLSFRSHLELGSKPLLPTLRKRLGALKHLSKSIPRKGRLVLSNGLILSKIMYMIPIWGGTHQVHMRKVQKILNMTARFVNNCGRKWKTQKLMESCGWFTANELVVYHSLITLWKILYLQIPGQLFEKYEIQEDMKITTNRPRLQITSNYFRWRSCNDWNKLPSKGCLKKNEKIAI